MSASEGKIMMQKHLEALQKIEENTAVSALKDKHTEERLCIISYDGCRWGRSGLKQNQMKFDMAQWENKRQAGAALQFFKDFMKCGEVQWRLDKAGSTADTKSKVSSAALKGLHLKMHGVYANAMRMNTEKIAEIRAAVEWMKADGEKSAAYRKAQHDRKVARIAVIQTMKKQQEELNMVDILCCLTSLQLI